MDNRLYQPIRGYFLSWNIELEHTFYSIFTELAESDDWWLRNPLCNSYES